jgi:phosphoglycerate dehydrogenase-like enzyme
LSESPTGSQHSPDVLITDARAVLQPAAERLENLGASVQIMPDGSSPKETAAAASGVPVILIGMMPFGAEEISQLDRTGLIIRAGIGYDMVDVAAATASGILVVNVPDYCVDEVADHTLMLLVAAMRRLPAALSVWRDRGEWAVAGHLPEMRRMRGRRLGIVGLGRIGREVAVRAQAFGWEVVAHDPDEAGQEQPPGVDMAQLDEILETTDAITLHCPLNNATRRLMREETFQRMKPGCVLVNTSRGGLVDLSDLSVALDHGLVSVAALDVLEDEPHPDLGRAVLSDPRVIVTPHVAWRSSEAQRELALNSAEEAIRFLEGRLPSNIVNRELVAGGVTRWSLPEG